MMKESNFKIQNSKFKISEKTTESEDPKKGSSTIKHNRPKILLSGVFGPYGVDDEFGRAENIMELFHNQVTKAQGNASLRFHHRSFGLYFLAANVHADTTILDFPSRRQFICELRKNDYDYVGISFITPNFLKAREMARLIREHSPSSKIILGGHGAAIEGIENRIDCDEVVRGEGVCQLRRILGEDVERPVIHPVLPANEYSRVFGVPIGGSRAGLLVPGVGCVNGCRFCSTSHFFGKEYTPYIRTGQQMFDLARQSSTALNTRDFFVMDENFLKKPDRALELIECMKRNDKWFNFYLFSSADTIRDFGMDNLVKLGTIFTWIGFESPNNDTYEKTRGINPGELVETLRDHGVSVLASAILGTEEHTPDTIGDDIEYFVGLNADLIQFMLLTALPVTGLYQKMQASERLREDLPFEDWHGQKVLNWRHDHLDDHAAEHWLNHAFRRDYDVNSSSIYRMAETAFRGWERLKASGESLLEEAFKPRLESAAERVRNVVRILPTVIRNAVNAVEKERAELLLARIRENFGPASMLDRLEQAGARWFSSRWARRVRRLGDRVQPVPITTRHRPEDPPVFL
jgi:radical SAM superfamily enzyme YgiQ (UPF0313 family)